ncbi:hypothetical protein HK102_004352 [Quaeritorhiza haematococci]|nr:hypothetical protein HK102_004352 [Quaeritorhiza haematococci]
MFKRFKGAGKAFSDAMKNTVAPGGALDALIQLFSDNQLQVVLLSWIPVHFGPYLNTGLVAVDMFITTAIATLITTILKIFWVIAEVLFKLKPDSDKLSIKVEYYRLDHWGERCINPHYVALAWLISRQAKDQKSGSFRMMVLDEYIAQEDLKQKWVEMSGALKKAAEKGSQDSLVKADSGGSFLVDNEDECKLYDFSIIPRDSSSITIKHDGHEFVVLYDEDEAKEDNDNNNNNNDKSSSVMHSTAEPPLFIHLDENDPAAATATVEWYYNWLLKVSLEYKQYQARHRKRSRYEIATEDCYWYCVQNLHCSRGLSAVALDRPQELLLKQDLETFLKDRDFYARLGIPYKRGYLLSGRPGCGKTSLVHAISASYNRDLYYLNLKTIKDDHALQSAFSSAPKNAIIVFEDIDAQSTIVHSRASKFAHSKKVRAIKGGDNSSSGTSTKSKIGPTKDDMEELFGPTLSCLLNCLDGYLLDEGVIVIMTTNHPEVLDPALIRPGRIDLHLELGYCTHYQLERMYKTITGVDEQVSSLSSSSSSSTLTLLSPADLKEEEERPLIDLSESPECGFVDLDFSSIPERVLSPCDAVRIMMLFRSTPHLILKNLEERAQQLLSGTAVGDDFVTEEELNESAGEVELEEGQGEGEGAETADASATATAKDDGGVDAAVKAGKTEGEKVGDEDGAESGSDAPDEACGIAA